VKNILFVLGTFLPNPSANGLCVLEIIKLLQFRGYSVTVLSTNIHNEKDLFVTESLNIYRINDRYIYTDSFKSKNIAYKKIVKCIDNFLSFIKLIFGYNISFKRSRQFTKKSIELINKFDIDTIISVIRPVEALHMIPFLKKHYPDRKYIAYNLDVMYEKHFKLSFLNKLYWDRTTKFYYNCFTFCDLIVHMKYAEYIFYNNSYSRFFDKMIFSDIPLFRKLKKTNNGFMDMLSDKINIVFTGSFSKKVRNPEPILKIFRNLPFNNYSLHLYSRGCEDIIDKYQNILGNKLIFHGFVTPEHAYNSMIDCDILLNISNDTSYQVPSKIFEYFSTGKPIINYISKNDDPALRYYKAYDNILNIFHFEDLNNVIPKLSNFIIENKSSTVIPFDKLKETYYQNTPNRFIEILEEKFY
jgi:hypothetical protein